MAVTLKEVAKKAGVHPSVVSRILNNKADNYNISEKRKNEIRQAAVDLGYVPNISARIIQKGSFGCVALLLSSDSGKSYLPSHLLESIHDELEKNNKHLLLTKLPDAYADDRSQVPKVLQTLMADGLIIDYTHQVSEGIVSQIENHTLPAVWINIKRERDSIYPNNIEAGKIAVRKLTEAGRKNIAYVTEITHFAENNSEYHYSVADRYAGYEIEMKKMGLIPRNINNDDELLPREKQVDYFTKILSQPDRPDALVLYWSSLAAPVIHAARNVNLRIPEDLSIITFSSYLSQNTGLTINALVEPEIEMGVKSVKMLNQKMKNPDKNFKSQSVDFSYWKGGSVK
jgi:LacI family transcriptional regulator